MKFAIITHVIHGKESGHYFGYEPYVREMNLWLKNTSEVIVVAPLHTTPKSPIQAFYRHDEIDFVAVPDFDITSFRNALRSILVIPIIFWRICGAMRRADHIHLRCPGNIGLLGCFAQMFFPSKPKTAKYAGNWDPKAAQPLTYRLQKSILKNTFLTRNMKVLVYGHWEQSTRNIVPFFTASYYEKDKVPVGAKSLESQINFLFVGTLSNGKQPLYAIKLVERLKGEGKNVRLSLYGDGAERTMLEKYILENKLTDVAILEGNQNQDAIKKAYQESLFVILPSLSEGWPKVVAEGMFWGCLPVASKVSCVPDMLGNGERGIILGLDLDADAAQLLALIQDSSLYALKVEKAMDWSRQFTMDTFENEIKKLLE